MKLCWLKFGMQKEVTLGTLAKQLRNFDSDDDIDLRLGKVRTNFLSFSIIEKKVRRTKLINEDGEERFIEGVSFERNDFQFDSNTSTIIAQIGGRSLRRAVHFLSEATDFNIWIELIKFDPSKLLRSLDPKMNVTNAKLTNIQVSKEFVGETNLRGEGSLDKVKTISEGSASIGSLEGVCKHRKKTFRISAGSNGVVKLLTSGTAEDEEITEILTSIITSSKTSKDTME